MIFCEWYVVNKHRIITGHRSDFAPVQTVVLVSHHVLNTPVIFTHFSLHALTLLVWFKGNQQKQLLLSLLGKTMGLLFIKTSNNHSLGSVREKSMQITH